MIGIGTLFPTFFESVQEHLGFASTLLFRIVGISLLATVPIIFIRKGSLKERISGTKPSPFHLEIGSTSLVTPPPGMYTFMSLPIKYLDADPNMLTNVRAALTFKNKREEHFIVPGRFGLIGGLSQVRDIKEHISLDAGKSGNLILIAYGIDQKYHTVSPDTKDLHIGGELALGRWQLQVKVMSDDKPDLVSDYILQLNPEGDMTLTLHS